MRPAEAGRAQGGAAEETVGTARQAVTAHLSESSLAMGSAIS